MRIIVYTLILSVGFCLTCGCRNETCESAEHPAAASSLIAAENTDAAAAAGKQSVELEEKWGIKVEAVHLSAGGYMIDFRYRVIDAKKAAAIADPKEKPYIIDQATGAKFIVPAPPKVGPLRNTKNIQADRVYFIFFANPGKYIKTGQKITVCVGEVKIENLEVM